MTLLTTIILVISIVLSIITIGYYFFRMKLWKSLTIFVLGVWIIIILFYLVFDFPNVEDEMISKGKEKLEWPFLIVLYFFIILGMFSQYMYKYLSGSRKKHNKFDFGLFLAPLFVSPIVVMPLYSAFLNSEVVFYPFSQQSLMIYIVAFENGFFWESIISNRKKNINSKKGEPKN